VAVWQPIPLYSVYPTGDNMTLRDEINKSREENDADKDENWKMADEAQTSHEINQIIYRIDEMDDRLYKFESELTNLLLRMDSLEFASKVHTVGGTIKLGAMPEPSEPFPGYNDLMKEALPVIREYIAEKKRETDHKVVPMKVSED